MALLSLGSACSTQPDLPIEGESPGTKFQGATSQGVYPVVVSSDLAVGSSRVIVALRDGEGDPHGGPEITLDARFFDLGSSDQEPVANAEMRFLYTIPDVRGVYVALVDLPRAGEWGLEATLGGSGDAMRTSFVVNAHSSTPAVGAPAPSVETPTASDLPAIAGISTDPDPDPALYRISLADALDDGEAFVVAFASPRFCVAEVCGPTLDVVKEVSRAFPDVRMIHVEPYRLPAEPNDLETVPAVREWGLPTEPWVFVVDATGDVTAKFEGAVSAEELKDVVGRL